MCNVPFFYFSAFSLQTCWLQCRWLSLNGHTALEDEIIAKFHWPLIWLWCNGGHQTCKRCSAMLRMVSWFGCLSIVHKIIHLLQIATVEDLWVSNRVDMSACQVVHQYSFYLYVVPIIIFSVLYNMPKFYELQVILVWASNNSISALILVAPGDGRVRLCSPAPVAPGAGGRELLWHGGHPPAADGAPRHTPPAENCPGESGYIVVLCMKWLLCDNSPLLTSRNHLLHIR